MAKLDEVILEVLYDIDCNKRNKFFMLSKVKNMQALFNIRWISFKNQLFPLLRNAKCHSPIYDCKS